MRRPRERHGPATVTQPWEYAALGGALGMAGLALIVWGWRHRGTWLEGDCLPEAGHYSVHRPPSAPGIKRIVAGGVLVVLGVVLLARWAGG